MGNTDFDNKIKITWMDRRMGEISMRFIGAGLCIPPDVPLHFSERLKKIQGRKWFTSGWMPDKERLMLFRDTVMDCF